MQSISRKIFVIFVCVMYISDTNHKIILIRFLVKIDYACHTNCVQNNLKFQLNQSLEKHIRLYLLF